VSGHGVQIREVTPGETELRLDRWFQRHFPGVPHGRLQKLLRTGQLRVDGRRAEAGQRLQGGQKVRIPPLAAPPEPAPRPATTRLRPHDDSYIRSLVLHEDSRLFVLAKPAGLAVQGGTGTTRHVDAMLDALSGPAGRPRLVHRLDRDTSGLLVVARDPEAAAFLTRAFRQHRVRKLYWAIVLGRPQGNEGVIDRPLAKAGPAGRERMAEAADGKRARTQWRVVARAGKVGAWMALLPETGRTHQLRVHMAEEGTPILGDGKYGGKAAKPDSAPRGLMLHARELRLPHPDGGEVRLTAPLSPEMKAGFAWLGFADEPLPGNRLADWGPT
jgi:23S rRNA pseudouridine955/2504/2580 synthase